MNTHIYDTSIEKMHRTLFQIDLAFEDIDRLQVYTEMSQSVQLNDRSRYFMNVSLESLYNPVVVYDRNSVSMEGVIDSIKEGLSKIWRMIKKGFEIAYEQIKKIMKWVFSETERVRVRAQKLQKRIQEGEDGKGDTIESKKIERAFSINDKFDVSTVETILKNHLSLSDKFVPNITTSATVFVSTVRDIIVSLSEMNRLMEDEVQGQTSSLNIFGIEVFVTDKTKELLKRQQEIQEKNYVGIKAFLDSNLGSIAGRPTESGEASSKSPVSRQLVNGRGLVMVSDEAEKRVDSDVRMKIDLKFMEVYKLDEYGGEIPRVNNPGMRKLVGLVINLMNSNDKIVKVSESLDKLVDQFDKIIKVIENLDVKSGTENGQDAKKKANDALSGVNKARKNVEKTLDGTSTESLSVAFEEDGDAPKEKMSPGEVDLPENKEDKVGHKNYLKDVKRLVSEESKLVKDFIKSSSVVLGQTPRGNIEAAKLALDYIGMSISNGGDEDEED